MLALKFMEANSPSRTRPFAQAADPKPSFSHQKPGCSRCMPMFAQSVEEPGLPSRTVPSKRRTISVSRSNMQAPANSPATPVSFPSFMSVFGTGPGPGSGSRDGREERLEAFTAERPSQTPKLQPSESQPNSLPFQHRQSISSVVSESTDSSPTTTISTFDSPSVTDTSPSSSPESPTSIAPLLKTMTPHNINGDSNNNTQEEDELRDTFPIPSPQLPSQRRPDSPGRRARNLKNLTLNMPAPTSSRPTISTASVVETSHNLSAPSSPIKPPLKTARRRPANLTIRTPCLDRSFSNNVVESGPQSAHPKPTLRHIESSPSLPSLFSPTTGPADGMQLPRPVTSCGSQTIPESWEDLNSAQFGGRKHILSSKEALHELKEEEDPPVSRESQKADERGYPDGPIRIYDSGVYLYLEPTREEASKFDVVFNVAKEVANPFVRSTPKNDTIMSVWRNAPAGSKRASASEPQTAVSEVSFKSAFEYLPGEPESPTTPKAETSEPEYIHVPWDHNSEILDDLHRLCETIDDRISKGKSVLIHCQLGVSRSASLVIAYGLYKNRDMDFNSMYGVVKERSSWVGPNMSLIYQLTDFRSRLLQGNSSKETSEIDFNAQSSNKDEEEPIGVKPDAAAESGSNKQPRRYFSHHLPPIPKFDVSRGNTRPLAASRSSSALNSRTSRTGQRRNLMPRPLPLREKYHPILPPSNVQQQQAESNTAHSSLSQPSQDHIMEEVPETPSLFSPRVAGFISAPFTRTAAGDLHGTSEEPLSPVGCGSNMDDPRSPPQRTEPFIMRNIDEFL